MNNDLRTQTRCACYGKRFAPLTNHFPLETAYVFSARYVLNVKYLLVFSSVKGVAVNNYRLSAFVHSYWTLTRNRSELKRGRHTIQNFVQVFSTKFFSSA